MNREHKPYKDNENIGKFGAKSKHLTSQSSRVLPPNQNTKVDKDMRKRGRFLDNQADIQETPTSMKLSEIDKMYASGMQRQRMGRKKKIATIGIVAMAAMASVAIPVTIYAKQKDEMYGVVIQSEAINFEAYEITIKRGDTIAHVKNKLNAFEGHILEGLYVDRECTIPFEEYEKVKKNATVYVKYEKKTYSIILPQSAVYSFIYDSGVDINNIPWGDKFGFNLNLDDEYSSGSAIIKANGVVVPPTNGGEYQYEIEVKETTAITVEGLAIKTFAIKSNSDNITLRDRNGNPLNATEVEYGTTIIIGYNVTEGCEKTAFTINGENRENNTTITVYEEIDVVYTEEKIKYDITIPENVTVLDEDNEPILDGKVAHGEQITIVYSESTGHHKTSFKVNGVDCENNKTITVEGNINIEYTQEANQYTLSFETIPGIELEIKNGESNLTSASQLIYHASFTVKYNSLPGFEVKDFCITGVNDGTSVYEVPGNTLNTYYVKGNVVITYKVYTHITLVVDGVEQELIKVEAGENVISSIANLTGYTESNTCGWFTDEQFINGLSDDAIIDSSTIKLYTKTATTENLAFTSINGGDEYEIKGISAVANVVIPKKYNGKPVTKIADKAFQNFTISSAIMPSTIKIIGVEAFYRAANRDLKYVNIPNGVTIISNKAFKYNLELTTINLPKTVTIIGDNAFESCSGLTEIILPESVQEIGKQAFYYCSTITEINIPKNVTSIGSGAFGGCHNLATITVDSNNTVYDSRNNCNAIIEIRTNTLISACGNTGSTETTGITGIVTIPDSVVAIGHEAFFWNDSITSIKIPASVTSILEDSIRGCKNLETIIVDGGNTKYTSRDKDGNECNAIIVTETTTDRETGVEISKDVLIVGCKNTTIPTNVTVLGTGAFYGSGLTELTIPDNVIEMRGAVFHSCKELTDITLSNNITTLGAYVFQECYQLTNIIIPNSVEYIAQGAFNACIRLESIVIPESVKTIGAFAFVGCSRLVQITFEDTKNDWQLYFHQNGVKDPFWFFDKGYILTDLINNPQLLIKKETPEENGDWGYAEYTWYKNGPNHNERIEQ